MLISRVGVDRRGGRDTAIPTVGNEVVEPPKKISSADADDNKGSWRVAGD